MNTTELIEIARECGGRYAYTNWGYHPFSLTELQQFTQRIEQPLQHRINELAFDVAHQQSQIAELEIALQKQAKAALSGMDSASASGAAMLKAAKEIHSQLKPELLDSELQANSFLTEENERLRQHVERLEQRIYKISELSYLGVNAKNKQIEQLRKALEKIADLDGNWGPFPETNKQWCAMAIVTAREALEQTC